MKAGPGDGTGLPVAAGADEAAGAAALIAAPPRRTGWARVRRWMRRNPLSVAGAAIVLGLVADGDCSRPICRSRTRSG